MTTIRPVVVIGAARSGTKVLRDSLAAAVGAGRVPYDVGYVWRYGNESSSHDCLSPADATPKTRALVRDFVGRYASPDGLVVEKTVGNTLRVGFVADVLPEAVFVYLERDGVDVAVSACRQWSAPTDLSYLARKLRHFPMRLVPTYGMKFLRSRTTDRLRRRGHPATWGPRYPGIDEDLRDDGLMRVCARQWRWSVTTARREFSAVRQPVVRVSYAELVDAPQPTLSRVAAELSLPAMESRLAHAASLIRGSRPRPARPDLLSDQRAALREELGKTLSELGYAQP